MGHNTEGKQIGAIGSSVKGRGPNLNRESLALSGVLQANAKRVTGTYESLSAASNNNREKRGGGIFGGIKPPLGAR